MISIGMFIQDRYEILDKIGTGGMADVYKAKDHKLNRFVAIKVLKPEFAENKNFVSKFIVEAQATAGLMHHNIVNVYDVGEENGTHYIVMELVEGITLKKYIEKKVMLTSKEAISIAIQVAMGIEAAHNNHIIHRDIKPQNIIISKEGKVKVTDFGIAKAATSNTISSNVMGSVHYTSPEQARGGFSDEKSDIYSLGITMFEMLTGRVPFNGDTTVAIAIKHIQDEMPSPRSIVPDIPISVEQIIMKCTQKKPDRRYQSMGEIIQDLKRSLIAPNEAFVDMGNDEEIGKTKIVPERIKTPRPEKPVTAEDNFQEEEVYTEKKTAKPKPEKKPASSRPEKRPSRKRETILDEEEYLENDKEEIKQPKKKNKGGYKYDPTIDKVLTGITVILAIVIGCLIIYFAGTAFGLFDTSKIKTNTPGSENASAPVISTSEKGVKVPNVVGASEAEATSNIKNCGFKIEKEYESSKDYPKGTVIRQSVEADTMAALETLIKVTISSGATEEMIPMPKLLGMSREEMEVVLDNEGLVLGEFEETYSTEYPEGQICYQGFEPDTQIPTGTRVNVKVSIGAETVIYSCNLVIQTPANYAGGKAEVILMSGDGTEKLWYSDNVTSFPLNISLSNFPSTSSYGIVYITYIKNQETTVTDGDGNASVQVTPVVDQIQQSVEFTKQ